MLQNNLTKLHTRALKSSTSKAAIASVASPVQDKSKSNGFDQYNLYPNKKTSTNNQNTNDSVTDTWLKAGSTKAIAKMYFPEDYSQVPTKVGRYTLDPNQSRIGSAIGLGKAPFANGSKDIADYFGFSTASSSGGSPSSSEAQSDLLEKDENEDKESTDDIGDHLEKELNRIEREELSSKLEKINPKNLKELEKIEKKDFRENLKQDSSPNKVIKEEPDQKKVQEQQSIIKPHQEEEKAPPPPPMKEPEEEDKK